jgi:hypothetical protein
MVTPDQSISPRTTPLNLAGELSANGAGAGSGGQVTTAAPSITLGDNLNVEAQAGEASDNARGTWQIETAATYYRSSNSESDQ